MPHRLLGSKGNSKLLPELLLLGGILAFAHPAHPSYLTWVCVWGVGSTCEHTPPRSSSGSGIGLRREPLARDVVPLRSHPCRRFHTVKSAQSQDLLERRHARL